MKIMLAEAGIKMVEMSNKNNTLCEVSVFEAGAMSEAKLTQKFGMSEE